MPRIENTVINVVDVRRHGEAIVIPESLSLEEAIAALHQQLAYDQTEVQINVRFDAFLLDGALALQKALAEKYGWTNMIPTPGFWGPSPPQMITLSVSPTESVQVPWGRMTVPGISGWLATGQQKTNDGRMVFTLSGLIKRRDSRAVDEITALTRLYLREQSIYRGKAIRLRFRDEDGDPLEMPEPVFMDLSKVREEELIFSKHVATAIEASLFTPIQYAAACRKLGVPLKRGVLLAGPYGVGKTLAAQVAAVKAQQAGWTFIYCETSPELSEVVRFAQQYAPAVVFCEDIDRVVSGDRDVSMDDILAIVDGVGQKDSELMIVLTTNQPEAINQAMLRPGRLDAIINVTPPDPEAVIRLVRLYARESLPRFDDLDAVGAKLAGQIPAVIRECVERAKLHALHLSAGEDALLSPQALLDAADEMQFALGLLEPKTTDKRSKIERAADVLAEPLQTLARAIEVGTNGERRERVEVQQA